MGSSPARNAGPGPENDPREHDDTARNQPSSRGADDCANHCTDGELQDARALYKVMTHTDHALLYRKGALMAIDIKWCHAANVRPLATYHDVCEAQFMLGAESFARGEATKEQLMSLGQWLNWCARVGTNPAQRLDNPTVGPPRGPWWKV